MPGMAQLDFDRASIELLLEGNRLGDALSLLATRLAGAPLNREAHLYYLLVLVRRHGPEACEKAIDALRQLVDLNANEKKLVRSIFLIGFEAAEKAGLEEKTWAYQRLLRKLLLDEPLNQPIPFTKVPASPPARHFAVAPITVAPVPPVQTSRSSRTEIVSPRKVPAGRHAAARAGVALLATGLLTTPLAYLIANQDRLGFRHAMPRQSEPASAPRKAETIAPAIDALNRASAEAVTQTSMPAEFQNLVTGQLSNLRRVYGRWTARNLNLMGSLLLKLTVNSSGKVVQAEKITSGITNNGFIKAVLAEALHWKFAKGTTAVTMPLLFVPKGMQPATVVRWEGRRPDHDVLPGPQLTSGPLKAAPDDAAELGSPASRPDLDSRITSAVAAPPISPTFALAKPATKLDAAAIDPKSARGREPASGAKKFQLPTEGSVLYKTLRRIPLRDQPRFAADTKQEIDGETPISVLSIDGDWLQVKAGPSGLIGYIRREHVTRSNLFPR